MPGRHDDVALEAVAFVEAAGANVGDEPAQGRLVALLRPSDQENFCGSSLQ
jgi:hypothetical protein